MQYRLGPNVDSSGQFIDGTAYQDFLECKTHLSSLQQDLARAFTKKLLTFATGRELGFSDRGEIERIAVRKKRISTPRTPSPSNRLKIFLNK